jgi:hypothetical protein
MKKIMLRRTEVMGHLPKEVRASAISNISSVYVNRQPLKGIEGEEAKKIMNGFLDVAPDHVDWPKYEKQFWTNLAIKVPFEGVELEIGLDENGRPYNLDHYLKYRFCLKHPYVADNKKEVQGRQRFYFVDADKDIREANKKVKLRKEADKEFIKASSDEKKMDMLLRLLSKTNPNKLTREQKENNLYELKNNQPAKFFKLATDKNLEIKSEIDEMVEAGVLRKIGNQVIYIDEVLGETTEDTIIYLRNKKNSGTLTILRAKLKEASI